MSLSHEHVGPKILRKIKMYVLTRAELLFPLCYEIPCRTSIIQMRKKLVGFRNKQEKLEKIQLPFCRLLTASEHNA